MNENKSNQNRIGTYRKCSACNHHRCKQHVLLPLPNNYNDHNQHKHINIDLDKHLDQHQFFNHEYSAYHNCSCDNHNSTNYNDINFKRIKLAAYRK